MKKVYRFNGRAVTIEDLLKIAAPGLTEHKIRRRLADKWDINDAISLPPGETRSRKKVRKLDDIRLYIVCCWVHAYLMQSWERAEPVRRLEDGQYELRRRYYTWRFKFADPMRFYAAAYYRKTGKLSYPIYECSMGGGRISILNVIAEDGTATPYAYEGREVSSTRLPPGYELAMKMKEGT